MFWNMFVDKIIALFTSVQANAEQIKILTLF